MVAKYSSGVEFGGGEVLRRYRYPGHAHRLDRLAEQLLPLLDGGAFSVQARDDCGPRDVPLARQVEHQFRPVAGDVWFGDIEQDI